MKDKKELIRAIKFTLFSISAGVIQALFFTILKEFMHLNYWVSYLTALILSVLWNFTLNRNYTFKSASNIPIAMFKVAIFYLIFTLASTYLGALATDNGLNEYLVLALSMFANFVLEFLYDRFFVFGKTIDTKQKT